MSQVQWLVPIHRGSHCCAKGGNMEPEGYEVCFSVAHVCILNHWYKQRSHLCSPFWCIQFGTGMAKCLPALLLTRLCTHVPGCRAMTPQRSTDHARQPKKALNLAHPLGQQSRAAARSVSQKYQCGVCRMAVFQVFSNSGQCAIKPSVANGRKNTVLKGQSADTL